MAGIKGFLRSFRMPRTGLLLVAACVLLVSGCEKWRLDAQVSNLCAKDGGIRVYETVRLPADQFDQWGMVLFFDPTLGEGALGPDYLHRFEVIELKKGSPNLRRVHVSVTRRADQKLLAETVVYERGGGDFPSPMSDSSFACPDLRTSGENALLKAVFRPI